MSYKDFSRGAAYGTTCIDHSAYMRTAKKISPWSCLPGWRVESVSWDFMHLVWLGVGRDTIPSTLKLLRQLGYHYEPGESVEEYLKKVTMEMKMDCKDEGSLVHKPVSSFAQPIVSEPISRIYLPRRCITTSNTAWAEYPELNSKFKASHVKIMHWWLTEKLRRLTATTDAWFNVLLRWKSFFLGWKRFALIRR